MSRFGVALQPLKIGANVGGVLVAQIAVLLQGFEDDVFELGRQIPVETNGRRRHRIEDGFENDAGTLAVKRHSAGSHLVENRSKGKKIGASVQFLGPYLLRRHVGHGPDHGARAGQIFFACRTGLSIESCDLAR